ncbi:dof zinc finger protein DOF3.1-like [Canna indica]|uniref:Dof zinc finger protein DOF3.1-like n=1 Tax=Canna indica TaxID=4628 RepID=A0AAQ3JWW4_9LILI|nr:dof zinc finger protein DOF3.1-like [Canna indica]
MLDMTGSFSSLLACDGHFDSFLGSFPSIGPLGGCAAMMPNSSEVNSSTLGVHGMELQSLAGNDSALSPPVESFDRLEGDSGCWAAAWTDLAIYNPSSSLQ